MFLPDFFMKSLFSTRNFAILLVSISVFFIGFISRIKTTPYRQVTDLTQRAEKLLSYTPSQRPSTFLQSLEEVQQLLFCQDGSRLFVRSGKGRIAVYETGSWKKLQQWKTDDGPIFASPDGKRLFVAGGAPYAKDCHFSHWDADTGKRLSSWSMSSLRQSPDFRTFSTISPDLSQVVLSHHERNPDQKSESTHLVNALWIIDAHTGKKLHQIPASLAVGHATFRWEEQTLLVNAHFASTLRLRTSDWQPFPSPPELQNSRFNAAGKLLAGAQNPEGAIFLRDETVPPRKPSAIVLYDLQTKTIQRFETDFHYIRAVFPAEDALIVYGVKKDAALTKNQFRDFVQIRTVDGKRIKSELMADLNQIDAQWKLVARREDQNYIEIYRIATGKRLCRLDLNANPLNGKWETLSQVYGWGKVEFSPGGKWCVVSNQSGLIRIWELPHV